MTLMSRITLLWLSTTDTGSFNVGMYPNVDSPWASSQHSTIDGYQYVSLHKTPNKFLL